MSGISKALIESAARGNPNDSRTLLQSISDELVTLHKATGTSFASSNPAAQKPIVGPPTVRGLSVVGANGAFTVEIANPAQAVNATIFHELSFSSSSSFSSDVTTLPASSATHVVYNAPAAEVFWRVRSSFDQQTWGGYVTTSTGAVNAGLQSTAATANASPLNQSNFATIDSVAAGSTANIRIYGDGGVGTMFPAVKGDVETLLPSATIINVPFSSNAIVAHDGETFRPLTRLPQAFPDQMTPVGGVSVVGGGAIALPTVDPVYDEHGHIIAYNVTSQGNGITGTLVFTITDSSGSGASTGAQTIQNGKLITLGPGNPGSGYSGHATIAVSGGISGGAAGGGRSSGGNGGRLIYNDGTT